MNIKKLKINDLVYLEWVDSSLLTNWRFTDELYLTEANCKTVGWVCKIDSDYIALNQNISGQDIDSDRYQICNIISIPKVGLTKIRRLKIK